MTLAERIAEMDGTRKRRWTFTLEPGRGQTYNSMSPTLYAHNEYPRSSVLAGQPERVWMECWDDWDTARKELDQLKKDLRRFKYDDFGPEGGTTHIDVDVLTRHLSDDTDY